MAEETTDAHAAGHADPGWFIAPGQGDYLAVVVVVLIIAGLYGIVWLYGAFDRWAEHKSSGTPLAKTIPTLLLVALLYEIFPLDHFHVLLPLVAILIALAADWSRFHLKLNVDHDDPEAGESVDRKPKTEKPVKETAMPPAAGEAADNV